MTIIRLNAWKAKKGLTKEMLAMADRAAEREPASDDPDAPFLTDKELVRMRPVARRGRSPKAVRKQDTHILFDPHVLTHLRASGRGWQTRVNNWVSEGVRKGVL
ncbi:MAG: BrnA antitoxin family protein [Candidatus Margulisbacteria bacterium]|jgi:uncharacterized protein (DUF4415 family)|nr:BrnA antitoxin family protein [Candidatus Margulisiibacteriota bacterium]